MDRLSQLLTHHFIDNDEKWLRRVENVIRYSQSEDTDPRNRVNNQVYRDANILMPSMFIGARLFDNDYDNETVRYHDYVQQLSNYFQHQSKLFADVLNNMKTQNPVEHKSMMLGHLLDLSKLTKLLLDFNVKLKKVQQISNLKWRYEVYPMLQKIVW